MLKVEKRTTSFLFIGLIYIIAFFIAYLFYYLTKSSHILVSTFIADVAATIVVWGFGLLFGNASAYDPYWSVAPIAIIVFWIIILNQAFNWIHLFFLAAIFIWGLRLTMNWAIRWKGFTHQDWRYTMLKNKNPGLWFFTNLIGINLMPTIIVYLALIPVYFGLIAGKTFDASIISVLGLAICLGAVIMQLISDFQMDRFKNNNSQRDRHIDNGLWRYSRHPNYFGEVSFWWGIWIIQLGADLRTLITVIGPIAMTLLFLFISIPMMETHITSSKPGYKIYKKQVSILIPWFRYKQRDA
ncbi:MAG: DUF1295 domain-containing protein [Actinomycetota bacterium]|nr:DUF1295 domain-containing protein [Actinomycetota bacterium]